MKSGWCFLIFKTHLKSSTLTFLHKYKKLVFQVSIRNCLFLGKYKKFFSLDQKSVLSSECEGFSSFEKLRF